MNTLKIEILDVCELDGLVQEALKVITIKFIIP